MSFVYNLFFLKNRWYLQLSQRPSGLFTCCNCACGLSWVKYCDLRLLKSTLTTSDIRQLVDCWSAPHSQGTVWEGRLWVCLWKKVLYQLCSGPLFVSLSSLQRSTGTDGSCDGGTTPGNPFHCKFAKWMARIRSQVCWRRLVLLTGGCFAPPLSSCSPCPRAGQIPLYTWVCHDWQLPIEVTQRYSTPNTDK